MTRMARRVTRTTEPDLAFPSVMTLRHRLAALILLAVAVAACATDGGEDVAVPTSTSEAPTTTLEAVAEEPVLAFAEPEDVFGEAIASLGTSYRFNSTVTTESGDEIRIDGYRVGDDFDYVAETGAASVRTIVTAGSLWVWEDDATGWYQGGESAQGDPLEPLRTPLDIGPSLADPSQLSATYDAADLGFGSDGTVEVLVAIDIDSIGFTYSDGVVTMRTTLTAAPELLPIAQPSTTP